MYLSDDLTYFMGNKCTRVCFFIVGGNGSGESRVFDEPSCPGNMNCRVWMPSG